jgi:hypothetical protein
MSYRFKVDKKSYTTKKSGFLSFLEPNTFFYKMAATLNPFDLIKKKSKYFFLFKFRASNKHISYKEWCKKNMESKLVKREIVLLKIIFLQII